MSLLVYSAKDRTEQMLFCVHKDGVMLDMYDTM